MGNVIGCKEITNKNYTTVYGKIKNLIKINGNYGVSISKNDIKKHIGLIVTV